MLGKLTRYELKKLAGGKFFLIALCLLLVANVLLNCGIQEFITWMNHVKNGTAMGDITPETTSFWSNSALQRQGTNIIRGEYKLLNKLTPQERAAFEAAMKERYGEDVFAVPIPTDEMTAVPGYLGGAWSDFSCIVNYQGMLERNAALTSALDNTVRAARAFGQESLEAGDNYGVRRNLNVIRLYSVPRQEITTPIRGWDQFLFGTPATMLLIFLLVLLACSGSFTADRDTQTFLLLHTAKNGKGKTLLAKYLAGVILAVVITVAFQLVALGSVWFKLGLLGARQPVSAIQELRLFPYAITVWQYVLLVLACQIFAAVMLAVLLTTVSAFSKSSIISYGAGAILLGLCLLPVYFPPKIEWLSGPLALSSPLKYFDSYYTANLFGFPVLWVAVQAALWCILGAGCMFLAHKVHHRKRGAV